MLKDIYKKIKNNLIWIIQKQLCRSRQSFFKRQKNSVRDVSNSSTKFKISWALKIRAIKT